MNGVMNNSITSLYIVLALVVFTTKGFAESLLRWPLDIKPALSSTFGESRSTSFHMGIDFKTWGRTGYLVRAISDGHVERIRTSPWGYGRAIYLRLNDGRLAVYAHLEEFSEFLKKPVASAQLEKGVYSTDIWFEPKDFKVSIGDVIGFTGESGAGPPHLHFEIRDSNNSPINPLKTDYSIADSTAPTLKSIAFIPIGWSSRVNGARKPLSVELSWDDIEQIYKIDSSIQIEGQVGVALRVWDRAEAAANKLAPYRLELKIADELLFEAQYDQAAYSSSHQIFLDRIKLDTPQGIRNFHALFRSKGNRLPFYLNSKDGFLRTHSNYGALGLVKGEYWLEVIAADIVGQSSSAHVKIVVNSTPAIRYAKWGGVDSILTVGVVDSDNELLRATLYGARDEAWAVISNGVLGGREIVDWPIRGHDSSWKLVVKDKYGAGDSIIFSNPIPDQVNRLIDVIETCRDRWIEWDIRTEQPLSVFPEALISDRVGDVRQIGHSHYIASFPLEYGESDQANLFFSADKIIHRGVVSQRGLVPGKARQLLLEDGQIRIDVTEKSVYDTLFPQVVSSVFDDFHGFKVKSSSFLITPIDTPFDEPITVGIRIDSTQISDRNIGLYGSSDGKNWTFLSDDRIDGYISASIRRLKYFALLADIEKPSLAIITPIKTSTADANPHIKITLRDDQSGIVREEDIVINLNQEKLIFEYDPEGHKAIGFLGHPLNKGLHVIEASVQDAAGNRTAIQQEFKIDF